MIDAIFSKRGRAVALIAWLALPLASPAQEPPNIRTGILIDDFTGRAIAGAMVSIEPGAVRLTTGLDGTFRTALAAGSYTLSAAALGYGELSVNIEVPANATGPLELRMTPAPLGVEGLDVGADADRARVEVRGMVTDLTTGVPLVGATVSFPFGNRRWITMTDTEGAFRIDGIVSGVQWVQARHLGYEGAAISVLVGAAGHGPVDIRLRPDSSLLAGVARIDARWQSQRRATAHMTVRHVDRERIAASPWWKDTRELLRSSGVTVLPCTSPVVDGSWCVAGRSSPISIEVCIDGVRAVGGLDQLLTYHPRELHAVDVFDRGALVHAYSVAYMEHYGRRSERVFACPDPNVP